MSLDDVASSRMHELVDAVARAPVASAYFSAPGTQEPSGRGHAKSDATDEAKGVGP